MRRVRGFSLVGIIEFIMYGCVRYFRERYASAASFMIQECVFAEGSMST